MFEEEEQQQPKQKPKQDQQQQEQHQNQHEHQQQHQHRFERNSHQQEKNEQTPITVLLTVDKLDYQAGEYVHGTVCLYVPQSAGGCEDFSGIVMSFDGTESILLSSERFEESIVNIETELMHFRRPLIAGHYEYPFYWKLPDSLPCSMICKSKDCASGCGDETSFCEVRYKLSAHLRRSHRFKNRRNVLIDCVKTIKIVSSSVSAPSLPSLDDPTSETTQQGNAIVVEPKQSSVRKWLMKKGSIQLGLDTNKRVVAPNETVTVGITGRNQSSMHVKHLLVRWKEIVEWGVKGLDAGRQKRQRILTEEKITLDDMPCWQEKSSHDAQRITVQLHLKNARDSYHGQLMSVQHSLQVIAVPKGTCVTKPKSTAIMQVQRYSDIIQQPVMVPAQLEYHHQEERHDVEANNHHEDAREDDKGTISNDCLHPLRIPSATEIQIPEAVALPLEATFQEEQHLRHFCPPKGCINNSKSVSLEPVVHVQILETLLSDCDHNDFDM